jgi:hypothetical protein
VQDAAIAALVVREAIRQQAVHLHVRDDERKVGGPSPRSPAD